MLGQQDKREICCMLVSQWLVATVFSLIMLILVGKAAALSAVLGAVVSILPTAVFACVLFRYQGARQARRIVRSLYVGEGLKLLLTALLFGGAIYFLSPIWWAFFVSFILVHMTLCIAPLFCVHGFRN